MASFTDQNGTPIKTTEQLQSWYKSQGYDWEKLDPELRQQALTGIGEQDRGFLAGARRIAASGAEGLTSLVTAPLTTLPGLVETGVAFGAEKLGATNFAKTMRSDAAQSFALGQKIQRGVSGALRSEYDLAQQQIDKRAIDAAATAAEKQGAGFFGQAGAEIKEYGSQILESPSKALEIGANVLAQGLGAGKLASAGSKKLLDAELKAVGKKGLKGDALREAGDAAVARVNKSIEFNTKAINAGLVSSDSASGAWENISKIPDSTWMNQAEYYDRVIAGNENSETVKEDIATRWVSAAGAAGLAGGLALNRIVGTPLESAFAKSFANSQKVAPAKGWGAAIKGAGKGTLEETSEEVALGAIVPNVAAQQINPEQRLSEGVGQAFVAGLGGGASVGGLTGFRGQQSDKAPDITSTPATTPVVPGETKVIVPDTVQETLGAGEPAEPLVGNKLESELARLTNEIKTRKAEPARGLSKEWSDVTKVEVKSQQARANNIQTTIDVLGALGIDGNSPDALARLNQDLTMASTDLAEAKVNLEENPERSDFYKAKIKALNADIAKVNTAINTITSLQGVSDAVQVESPTSQVLPTPEGGQVGVGLSSLGEVNQSDQVSAEESIKIQEELTYEMTRDSLRSRLEEQILQDRLARTGDTTVQDVQQQVQAAVTSPEEIAAAKAKIEDAFLADLIAGDESVKATQQAAVEQMQSVSDAETFNSRVAETDAKVRDSRIMTRLQTLLDTGAGFGSTSILDIDQKMQAIGEQPLNEQERARIQSIAGAYQTFMAQPALPQGAAAPAVDTGAQNAPLEALIPERKPKGALSARTTNVPRGTGLAARGANARANAQPAGAVADTTAGAPNRVGDGNQKPPAKGLKKTAFVGRETVDISQDKQIGQDINGNTVYEGTDKSLKGVPYYLDERGKIRTGVAMAEPSVDQIVEDSNGAIIPKCNL